MKPIFIDTEIVQTIILISNTYEVRLISEIGVSLH